METDQQVAEANCSSSLRQVACALAEVNGLRYSTAAAVRKPLNMITGRQYEITDFARRLKELSDDPRGHVLQRTGEIIMSSIAERTITAAKLNRILRS
jgi:hypothetical protein